MTLAALILAAALIPGPVPATVENVYDGDTITVRAHVWPGIESVTKVRIRGIDAPEIRGRCRAEKQRAREARDYLRKQLGERITLTNIEPDKYGRALADVATADGQSAAELLLAAGLARPYGGGRRQSWCDGEGR